jgi:hypothetical protein
MNLRTTFYALVATVAAGALFYGACRENNTDDCPATFTDKDGNGVSCASTDLQCPNTVTITACDGTKTTVASSCTCTKQPASSAGAKWVCADPGTACPDAGPTDDGGGDAGDDSATDALDEMPVGDAASDAADVTTD